MKEESKEKKEKKLTEPEQKDSDKAIKAENIKAEKKDETDKKEESEVLESILAVLIIAAVIIGLVGFAQGWFTHNSENNNPETRYNVDLGSKPLLGTNDAKVLIVEFSNYGCSHCREFALDTLPQIRAKYIDNKSLEKPLVAFAYRDFTIPNVISSASKASVAAECAYVQNKFWDFNEQLYQNQNLLDDIMIRKIAKNLSLDMVKFEACLKDDNSALPMINDYTEGSKLRISGTPTFFINGKKVVGAKSFEEFELLINEELAQINSSKKDEK